MGVLAHTLTYVAEMKAICLPTLMQLLFWPQQRSQPDCFDRPSRLIIHLMSALSAEPGPTNKADLAGRTDIILQRQMSARLLHSTKGAKRVLHWHNKSSRLRLLLLLLLMLLIG